MLYTQGIQEKLMMAGFVDIYDGEREAITEIWDMEII